ncbi:unnamed protein product [Adineta steineri]|uniref:TLC domain-containing protein n=1 Tax=Adineta steineri TaxID=433720 RepID=A0A819BPW8_9BILA|nr:unnamed protein product [Adineta steineri]CAF0725087.1 unnamed protein product [Adineta steineri]CAF0731942.1 unnamed protein product [Adineta steineri]CAF3559315.1 unnamed protein product [Adineta steineri]CAF3798038.1 unnamed protein product [Adineta steineri]
MNISIWNDQFWLPENITWNDFSQLEQNGIRLPQIHDLIYVYPLAGILYITRVLFENYIAQPFGRSIGIHDNQSNIKHIDKKSNHYKSSDNKRAKRCTRISPLTKFSESTWRFTFYLGIFLYGVIILKNKIWLWDTRHCWLNYPNHSLTNDVYWYYMMELAFYWSLLFSQFIDVKRKDFWEMFTHHIATISLLSFSYIVNFVRVGALVLVVHDCADYWLECAKMAKYARAQRTCDTMFVIFAVVWFITRLCYYPYKVLYTTTFEEMTILGLFPAYYVFNGLLILLQILHYFWFYLICQVAISACKAGEVTKDQRSDSEESDDEQDIIDGDVDKDK